MHLEPGRRLGPYEVLSALGAGGMGEVYRARDTKLDRDVALKVLPEAFTADPERLARFAREAKVLASLSHPNIAGIHGLEEADGTRALVLELVEGPTLAERIAQGPIPLEEALEIARQIAEALEAAHERGIVHRDLKPANVKLQPDGTASTGRVKVLDFGLAKALEPAAGGAAAELSRSPTLSFSAAATRMGVILGTAAYMAPEQARGRPVDRRADIWAFGCVLFEMLTRRRAFSGEDVSDTLAAVLREEPDWESLPDGTPAALRRLLRRCLQKDPRRRLRDMGDVRLEIEEVGSEPPPEAAPEPGTQAPRAKRAPLWGVVAVVVAAAAAAGAIVYLTIAARPAPAPVRAHLQVVLPEDLHLAVDTAHPTVAVSPDGSRLAFVASDGRTRRLYLRDLGSSVVRAIPGTEDAASPFFSPDGRWIGFLSGYSVMKVSSSSGAPVAVHTTTPISVSRGVTWVDEETVVHAPSPNTGLKRLSVSGEEQRPITEVTNLDDPDAHSSWPSALPAGRGVVFTRSAEAERLALLTFETGEVRMLGSAGTSPRYSETGHLLYGRGGSLYAVPFDADGLRTTGAERELLDGALSDYNGSVQYAVGGRTLAYVAGTQVGGWELAWVDREGRIETLLESERPLFRPRLSPDGSQLVVTLVDGSKVDVWLCDVERGSLTRRLTSHPGEDFGAVWHPDGRRLALTSEAGEDGADVGPSIAWIETPGAATEPLTATPGFGNWEFPASWSPDGKWIAYQATRDGPGGDLHVMAPFERGSSSVFLATAADERSPIFSPDGRWMAYGSNETGRYEVYVTSFPEAGDREPISIGGGAEPVWSRDGRELFYRHGDRMMKVDVDGSGSRFVAGEPKLLFELRFDPWDGMGASTASYDISPDGTRFVVARRKKPVTVTVIDVVLNWPETLAARAETSR